MIFVADESVDKPIVDYLRKERYEIVSIVEEKPGVSDDYVLELANKNEALLLTSDTDFGDLVFRQRKITKGVVLFRLAGLTTQKKIQIVDYFFKKYI